MGWWAERWRRREGVRDAKTEGDNSRDSEESVETAHTVISSSKLHKASWNS